MYAHAGRRPDRKGRKESLSGREPQKTEGTDGRPRSLTVDACGAGHDQQVHGGHIFCVACGAYTPDPMWLRKLTDSHRRGPENFSADQRRKRLIGGLHPMRRDGMQELLG